MLAGGDVRYTLSAQCLLALDLPEGSRREFYSGAIDVPHNRNQIAASFTGDWLLMIDDDHAFTPDLARRLLRHFADDRVDIVVPLVLNRGYPHHPMIGFESGRPTHPVRIAALTDETGLMRVDYAPTSAILFRRRVFERVPGPRWFERNPRLGHDYHFCAKARKHGCRLFCDLDTRIGHLTATIIWPSRNTPGGRWSWARSGISVADQRTHVEYVVKAHAETEPPESA
jgi:hypothetical protein